MHVCLTYPPRAGFFIDSCLREIVEIYLNLKNTAFIWIFVCLINNYASFQHMSNNILHVLVGDSQYELVCMHAHMTPQTYILKLQWYFM